MSEADTRELFKPGEYTPYPIDWEQGLCAICLFQLQPDTEDGPFFCWACVTSIPIYSRYWRTEAEARLAWVKQQAEDRFRNEMLAIRRHGYRPKSKTNNGVVPGL